MDTTLVTVTLLSLGMAAALSVIVWRMLRDEKQRSEARISALALLAARPAAGASPRQHPAAPQMSMLVKSPPATMPKAPAVTTSTSTMFEERVEESPWKNRLAVMAALGLVLASVLLFALAANTSNAPARSAAAGRATPAAATAAPAAGLELISLRDSRQADSLTITGLVRNPSLGAPLDRITVTAYTFDEKGSFLASGRALIDVTALAPGDESPFVVSVPVTETVARYRIGFRGEDGRVIAHVDKRQQGPIAANW
jgi:hypothetical protein